jgi:hypothetical protein
MAAPRTKSYGVHPDAMFCAFVGVRIQSRFAAMYRRISRRFSASVESPRVPSVVAAVFIVLGIGALIPFVVGASLVQVPPDGEKATRQRDAIRRELSSLDAHPWAGDYYEGDGLGANISLTLAPKTGVAATWTGCLGLYGANRGRIVENAGRLQFGFEAPNDSGFGGFPDEVVPVAWSGRRYLLPEAEMVEFVNALHHGREPRDRLHGAFLLARGDEHKSVRGLPGLPDRYLRMIRREPLVVGVLDAQRIADEKLRFDMCAVRYRLTFDRGREDGLTEGIRLKAIFPANVSEDARVVAATATQAVAEIERWEDGCKAADPQPDRSWTFSTGAYAPKASATL